MPQNNKTTAGLPTERSISTAEEWAGKHGVAEWVLLSVPGIRDVYIVPGTRGRPVDAIVVIVDPELYPIERHKLLIRRIETKLMGALKLVIDYRVVTVT